jgi:formamidopyrimidine-DNA glycosylase
MPELPEVESTVNWLNSQLLDDSILKVSVLWERMIALPEISVFQSGVKNQQVKSHTRRGKYIITKLESGMHLVMHLRMSGHLHILESRKKQHKHDRVVFTLASGRRLCFQDARKFGRLYLVENVNEVVGHLGPEPLAVSFSSKQLGERLQARKGRIKSVLLDQKVIAGLGNIYVDEALWRCCLHPERQSESLTLQEVQQLYRSIRAVLREAIKSKGTDFGDNVVPYGGYVPRVYGRLSLPCYRCRQAIEKTVVAQRGTHFCNRCQINVPDKV